MKKQIILNSPDETERIGSKIGLSLIGGECFELISDVGGGKTTFVRGLVAGAGSTDSVSSPTFTISKQYKTTDFDIYHFDFYRLNEPGLVSEELQEIVKDSRSVILVEWAQTVQDVLPKERVIIEINKMKTDQNKREMTIQLPEQLEYIMEALS